MHEEILPRRGENDADPALLCRVVVCVPGRDANDDRDPDQLTQTHLEQISANQEFRPIAEYFAKVNYFHLVPQMIRYPQAGGASPRAFGSSMIADMNATPVRTRQAWFRRIERALQSAVPGFETLRLEVDKAGQPHLIAGYRNWRRNPSEQNETDFSDGTLRLIGLLWTIISSPANGGVLLLEEPELLAQRGCRAEAGLAAGDGPARDQHAGDPLDPLPGAT